MIRDTRTSTTISFIKNSLTSQFTSGVSFYIVILLARIQALLRQGFGIPLRTENRKVKSKNIKATDKAQLTHGSATVIAKWSRSPRAT